MKTEISGVNIYDSLFYMNNTDPRRFEMFVFFYEPVLLMHFFDNNIVVPNKVPFRSGVVTTFIQHLMRNVPFPMSYLILHFSHHQYNQKRMLFWSLMLLTRTFAHPFPSYYYAVVRRTYETAW